MFSKHRVTTAATSVTDGESGSLTEAESVEATYAPFGLTTRTRKPPIKQVFCMDNTKENSSDISVEDRKQMKKTSLQGVRFSVVQCREYPRILGDNPAVKRGVPLALDWNVVRETSQSVDDYETERPSSERLTREELELKSDVRYDMAKAMGYSRAEITAVVKQVNIVKYRRLRTLETASQHPIQEVLQGLKRAAANATVRRADKEKERELLRLLRQDPSSRIATTTILPTVKKETTAPITNKNFRSLGEFQLVQLTSSS